MVIENANIRSGKLKRWWFRRPGIRLIQEGLTSYRENSGKVISGAYSDV
jgi:hypothetical protein